MTTLPGEAHDTPLTPFSSVTFARAQLVPSQATAYTSLALHPLTVVRFPVASGGLFASSAHVVPVRCQIVPYSPTTYRLSEPVPHTLKNVRPSVCGSGDGVKLVPS